MPSDVVVAKNYLDKKELEHLNRIGNMYLDAAIKLCNFSCVR